MKCLGLLGGDGVDDTATYAKRISDEMQHRFGHSEPVRMLSLGIQTAELSEALGKPAGRPAQEILLAGAEALVRLGAEAIIPCSSRLQVSAESLNPTVPVIPMFETVGAALQTLKVRRLGLIGALTEIEESHWRRRLARHQVLDTFVPVHRDREHLAHLIGAELRQGIVNQTTRADLGRIVYSLRQAGARAIVLAAPELGLALSHLDPVLPMLDAVELHALSALEWSLRPHTPEQSLSPRKPSRE